MHNTKEIRLIQWNCCGIRGKLPQLQQVSSEVDIMCIQESLLWLHNDFRINGFKAIRNDIAALNQRGICILVRESLVFAVIDLSAYYHPSWEIQGIRLPSNNNNESLVIINIYRHPNQVTSFNVINSLFSAMINSFRKVVFVGDYNAHHSWWGCRYIDVIGKTLSHIIDNHNLIILNDRSSPTFLHSSHTQSIIDLVLVTEDIAIQCSSITGSDTLGSDHLPIFTTIGGQFCFKKVFLYKLRVNSKDLILLCQLLSNSIDNLKSILSDDSLTVYTQTEQHIKNQLYSLFPSDSRLPRSRVLNKRPPLPPWWNEKCQRAIDERKAVTRIYLKHPTPDNFNEYKRVRSSCSRILKKQKRIGWEKYCLQFN